jgi:hypothetical protein
MRLSEIKRPRRVFLYHGTTRDNVPKILRRGLVPRVGPFVKAVYGSGTPAVFAASKAGLYRVVAAIVFQVGQKLGHGEISNREFWEHGAVVVLEKTPDWFRSDHPEAPEAAEHGDYWSKVAARPVKVLLGKDLENFIGVEPSEICDFVYDETLENP